MCIRDRIYPIQSLDGIANRCSGQLYQGQRTHIGWTAKEIILPTMPSSPASGAIIKVAGITGRIRGMKYKRADGKTVGRFDSRYTGLDRRGVGERPDYDPSYSVVQGPFTAGLNAYVRAELKYESDVPYEILTGRVQPWNYGSFNNRYVNVSEPLRSAMTQNPNLRVLVMSGYYDLATPHFAAAHTVNHLDLDATLRANISQTFYRAGHMMYLRRADLEKFTQDAARFYAR